MNKQRRRTLYTAVSKLESLIKTIESKIDEIKNNEEFRTLISDDISSVAEDICDVCDDEQFAYDNLPENFQYSEKGETMYDNIDALENCNSDTEDAVYEIEKGNISEAIELLKSAISYANDVQ